MTKIAHGVIECQFGWYDGWRGVFPIEERIDDKVRVFFAKLFDVENRTGLKPIADRRGLPNDLSDQARQDPSFDTKKIFNESYATFDEVKAVTRGHMSNPVNAIVDAMEKLVNAHGKKAVRLVIWFTDDEKTTKW